MVRQVALSSETKALSIPFPAVIRARVPRKPQSKNGWPGQKISSRRLEAPRELNCGGWLSALFKNWNYNLILSTKLIDIWQRTWSILRKHLQGRWTLALELPISRDHRGSKWSLHIPVTWERHNFYPFLQLFEKKFKSGRRSMPQE